MITLNGKKIDARDLCPGYYLLRSAFGSIVESTSPIEIHPKLTTNNLFYRSFRHDGSIQITNDSVLKLYSIFMPTDGIENNCVYDLVEYRIEPSDGDIVKIEYYVDIDKHGSAVAFPKGPFSDLLEATMAYKYIVNEASNEHTVTLEKLTTTRKVLRRSK